MPSIDYALNEAKRVVDSEFTLGKTVIDGDALFASSSEYTAEPRENKIFENHHAYIDVQMLIEGEEHIDVIIPAEAPETEYSDEKDIEFASFEKDYSTITLRAGNGYIYTDKNLIKLSEHTVTGYPADHDKYTGQGMYADSSYLYIPRSPTAGLPDNIIIVCDAEGKYLTTVRLATKMESETIFTLNGKFYVNFSRSASAICEVEFYEVFE